MADRLESSLSLEAIRMEVPPECATPGCLRPAAGANATGDLSVSCCPSCAMGLEQHDASCSGGVAATVHQRASVPKPQVPESLRMLLCRRGCGRRVTLGLRLNGELIDTCCRACASGLTDGPRGHDDECTACGIPSALGCGGLEGPMNAEEATAVGIVLGGMCGDALGSRVSGRTEDDIAARYPRGLTDFRLGRSGVARYSDCSEVLSCPIHVLFL